MARLMALSLVCLLISVCPAMASEQKSQEDIIKDFQEHLALVLGPKVDELNKTIPDDKKYIAVQAKKAFDDAVAACNANNALSCKAKIDSLNQIFSAAQTTSGKAASTSPKKQPNRDILKKLKDKIDKLIAITPVDKKVLVDAALSNYNTAADACKEESSETDEFCQIQTDQATGAFDLAQQQIEAKFIMNLDTEGKLLSCDEIGPAEGAEKKYYNQRMTRCKQFLELTKANDEAQNNLAKWPEGMQGTPTRQTLNTSIIVMRNAYLRAKELCKDNGINSEENPLIANACGNSLSELEGANKTRVYNQKMENKAKGVSTQYNERANTGKSNIIIRKLFSKK